MDLDPGTYNGVLYFGRTNHLATVDVYAEEGIDEQLSFNYNMGETYWGGLTVTDGHLDIRFDYISGGFVGLRGIAIVPEPASASLLLLAAALTLKQRRVC